MRKGKQAARSILCRLIKNWAVPVGCGLLFLFLLKFVFFIGYVPTDSMAPTIREGSLIVGTRIFGKPACGDIVVFEHDGRLLVKRVAGVPGDIVDIRGKTLTVPAGYYYMLGDNADNSADSRYWDEPFVRTEQVIALVILHTGVVTCYGPVPAGSSQTPAILRNKRLYRAGCRTRFRPGAAREDGTSRAAPPPVPDLW